MQLPKRKQIRLKGYDYSSVGVYFITICTHKRRCILSHIVGAIHESPENKLTQCGKCAREIIDSISHRFNVEVDKYVIMPDHVHMLISVKDIERRAIHESPLQQRRSTVSKIVGYFKMNVSKRTQENEYGEKLWQRGYHDHIVRNKRDYEKIWNYIDTNELKWELDCFYEKEFPR